MHKIFLILSLLIFGCATYPKLTDGSEHVKDESQKIKIELTRKLQLTGASMDFHIYDGDRYVGESRTGQSLTWYRNPGNMRIYCPEPYFLYGIGFWRGNSMSEMKVESNYVYTFDVNFWGRIIFTGKHILNENHIDDNERLQAAIKNRFSNDSLNKQNVAILNFGHSGIPVQYSESLTQKLITKMINQQKYTIVERTQMDKILKEQKFQHSGCTDQECAVKIGQLLNVDYIVLGQISQLESFFTVDARLISVSSGEAIISAEFNSSRGIESLLTDGMTSIAKQLCTD